MVQLFDKHRLYQLVAAAEAGWVALNQSVLNDQFLSCFAFVPFCYFQWWL